jgi:hypothetical protein
MKEVLMSPACILALLGVVAAVWSLFTPYRPPLAVAVILIGASILVSCFG